MTHLPKGGTTSGTRDLIRSTGWAATAMIALRAHQYVARKSDCHRLYRACIGDDWSDLLEEIYTQCRGAWHYLLPDRPENRARLRAICERTLSFENHFLAVYRDYAVSQLRSAALAHRLHALWVLEQLPLKDEQIFAALARLATLPTDPRA